jgi:hypothetical protein
MIRIVVGVVALIALGVGVYLLVIGESVGGIILTGVGVALGALEWIAAGIVGRRQQQGPAKDVQPQTEKARHEARFVNAFRQAQAAGVAVEVHLTTGERLLKGVHDMDEEQGFVSLDSPTTFGDRTTTREIPLDRIVSVSVTDVRWR